jgi:hypothetical protein
MFVYRSIEYFARFVESNIGQKGDSVKVGPPAIQNTYINRKVQAL